MKVDRFTGDPRIYGRDQIDAPVYDEGPLEAQPYDEKWEDPIIDDFEDEVKHYPFGEEAYLDTHFLQAVGTLRDRGLAGDLLRLSQFDGEFRHLTSWDKRLGEQERNLVKERGEFFEKRRKLLDNQAAVQKRLKKAKIASRLAPLLYDRPGRPGMVFNQGPLPTSVPHEADTTTKGCYWCGEKSLLNAHKDKECPNPHTKCHLRRVEYCLVPTYHIGYYGHMLGDNICPYGGNHGGRILRGDHA
jgi:hypothetical protein